MRKRPHYLPQCQKGIVRALCRCPIRPYPKGGMKTGYGRTGQIQPSPALSPPKAFWPRLGYVGTSGTARGLRRGQNGAGGLGRSFPQDELAPIRTPLRIPRIQQVRIGLNGYSCTARRSGIRDHFHCIPHRPSVGLRETAALGDD